MSVGKTAAVVWEASSTGDCDEGPVGGGLFDLDLVADHERVFVGRGGAMVCLDAATGSELWCVPMGPVGAPGLGARRPVVAGDRLIVQGNRGLVAFHVATGDVAWTQSFTGARSVHRDRLYILQPQSTTASYLVVDVRTGERLLGFDLVGRMAEKFGAKGSGRWRGRMSLTRPAISEDYVFFGDDVGRLWAIERETGEPVWFDLPRGHSGYLANAPVVAGSRVYATSFVLDDKSGSSALYCYEQA